MANPRVFISSTCYDLAEVRDTLVDFVRSFGFDPVLSERGDIFYHPDINTHDSCINEVSNCELFILIIGGRFGGTYQADTTKSIVNAEYYAARENKIPVFTFVKRNVHTDHFVYQKNKGNSDIVFPSIEVNDHAVRIFDFIDLVRHAPVNNGLFPFDFARDITSLLRKQWAAMFYDFLEERSASNQMATATTLLKNISVAGDKVEELVKSLYRHVDAAGADAQIEYVEHSAIAKTFFEEVFSRMFETRANMDFLDALINTPMNGSWYDYVATATSGEIQSRPFSMGSGEEIDGIVIEWDGYGIVVDFPDNPEQEQYEKSRKQEWRFEIVKHMDKKTLRNVLDDIDFFKE